MHQDLYLRTIPEDRSETSSAAPRFFLPGVMARGHRAPSEISNVASSVRNGARSETPSSVGAILPGSAVLPETAQNPPSSKLACERFLKRNLFLIVGSVILFMGVIVAIVLVATNAIDDSGSSNGPESLPASPSLLSVPTTSPTAKLDSPTSQPALQAEPSLLSPSAVFAPSITTPPPETIAELDATLRTVSSDFELIQNQDSHSYQARQWMLYQDLLRDDVISEGPFWVIQRYILVLLFFSMNGDQWVDSAREGYLIRDKSECQWAGVTCSVEDEAVVSLQLPFKRLVGTLPSELGHLSKLQWLNLTGNEISGSIPATFFDQFESLQRLDLSRNRLTGSIPPSLWSIPSLQIVALSYNFLSGPIELPAEASPAPGLNEIWLSHNSLTGSLPTWISELTKLTRLTAVNSNFTGQLPDPIPPALEFLNLYWNNLTGEIPESYFSSAKLVYLYLDFNQLSGSLPSIRPPANNSLSHLFLHNNRFSGDIPDSFGYEWTNLNKMFLHNNSALTGSLGPADDTLCATVWPEMEKMKADCSGDSPTVNCPCCYEC